MLVLRPLPVLSPEDMIPVLDFPVSQEEELGEGSEQGRTGSSREAERTCSFTTDMFLGAPALLYHHFLQTSLNRIVKTGILEQLPAFQKTPFTPSMSYQVVCVCVLKVKTRTFTQDYSSNPFLFLHLILAFFIFETGSQ